MGWNKNAYYIDDLFRFQILSLFVNAHINKYCNVKRNNGSYIAHFLLE